MAYDKTWNEDDPEGTDQIAQGDDEIRDFKYAIRERLAEDHVFVDDETGVTTVGYHKKVTLVNSTSVTLGEADAGILYAKDVASKAELFYMDEDDDEVQLTEGGKVGGTGQDAVFGDIDCTSISGVVQKKTVMFYVPVPNIGNGVNAQVKFPEAGTITKVESRVNTAPSGGPQTIQVQKDGVDILASALSITDGNSSASTTSFASGEDSIAADEVLTLDIDAVNGADGLTVLITIEVNL